MSLRSHLPLIRRCTVTNGEASLFAPVGRGVLKVRVLPQRWTRNQPLCFLVHPDAAYGSWYELRVLASPQFWLAHQHLADLFHKRLASCHHVRIYY